MNPEQILFILFGAVSLIGAIAVISFRHPIYSALSLIVTFFAQAGLFVLLGAHFVAAVQVIVYAGAIMVLFSLCDYAPEPRHTLSERGDESETEGFCGDPWHPPCHRRGLYRSECNQRPRSRIDGNCYRIRKHHDL